MRVLLASILKFVFIMMHLNHCIILFVEESNMAYRGEQNIEPQLGFVWNRCERPCRTQRDDSSCGIYVLTVITLILPFSTLSVDVAHANNRYYGYYFYCYS